MRTLIVEDAPRIRKFALALARALPGRYVEDAEAGLPVS